MKTIALALLAVLSLGAHANIVYCEVENNADLSKPNLSYTGVALLEIDSQSAIATFTLKQGPNIVVRKETLHFDGNRLITGEDAPTNDGFATYLNPMGERRVLLITGIGNIGKHGGMPASESNYDKANCRPKDQ